LKRCAGDAPQGINAVYRTPDDFEFEVQFHTNETIDTKMQKCHHSYERFREDHSMAKAQYWEEMVRMWSTVPIPQDVLELGELVVHTVSLDDVLKTLTPAERAVIANKQKLEDAVRPPRGGHTPPCGLWEVALVV
jgi:hypothetical protein